MRLLRAVRSSVAACKRASASARLGGLGRLASLAALAWVAVTVARPDPALGDDRTSFLIDRVKYPPAAGQSDDFRVRTNAALQLGRTNDDAAVAPLCAALSDPSDVVRLAVAAGLKRLGRPSAVPCLRDRLAVETNAAAKAQLQQSFDALAGGGGAAPPSSANAKNYVALSRVTNNTGRAQSDVDAVVLGAIRAKLLALGDYQLAPANESPAAARAVLSGHAMKGFYLTVAVDAFDYSGGNLRVKVKLTISGYPGKALVAFLDRAATQPGTQPGDKAAEDGLMATLAGSVVDQFAQSFP